MKILWKQGAYQQKKKKKKTKKHGNIRLGFIESVHVQ